MKHFIIHFLIFQLIERDFGCIPLFSVFVSNFLFDDKFLRLNMVANHFFRGDDL
jgi:hypothetical protein